jgi:hypothetical protein
MTNKTYIVGTRDRPLEDCDFAIIKAPDSDMALALYIRGIGIKDSLFLEYVYEKSINCSFAERFWLLTMDEQLRFVSGELITGADTFKSRVIDFFGENRSFAELYTGYILSDTEPEQANGLFPDDMLEFVYLHTDGQDLKILDLEDIPKIE